MKIKFTILAFFITAVSASAQIDPALLRNNQRDTPRMQLNMDAVYNRPFLRSDKLPVALGGYVEANYQYLQQDGITEGHQFRFPRLTLFVSSSISNRLKFLSEIEFEDGTKEINIEFASMDFEVSPLLNFRGGIVMNPIGAFNQNHDGPKWEFVDRPMSATAMLPATWSNVGFGLFGKRNRKDWVLGYELYLTNGFDDRIISNSMNRTALQASKLNPNRFEESFNGVPLLTAKTAVRNRKIGEIGVSYMGGVYNKFQDDGLALDVKRRVDVMAIDMNTVLPGPGTYIVGEWAFVMVDVPSTYTQQYGKRQQGGFVDIVQPVYKHPIMGFSRSVINAAMRLEYVDWNKGTFTTSGTNIGDMYWAIAPAISWRPTAQTVLRLNYRYSRQRDILDNPPATTGGFLFGFSTYF